MVIEDNEDGVCLFVFMIFKKLLWLDYLWVIYNYVFFFSILVVEVIGVY